MSDPRVGVVVPADSGARALVGTVDCLARQTRQPASVTIVCRPAREPSVVESLERRAGVAVVRTPDLNEGIVIAGRAAAGACLAIVPAGFRPRKDMLERCIALLERDLRAVAAVPRVFAESSDGLRILPLAADCRTVHALVASPFQGPWVWTMRRSAWEAVGGLRPEAGACGHLDLALRLLQHGPIVTVDEDLVRIDAAEMDRLCPGPDDGAYFTQLRLTLEWHRAVVNAGMREVLVAHESAFVTLRDAHLDLVKRRDADLAELDRLRAEAAHTRAWLAHHRRDAFDWGDFRRLDPVSREWGYDRGEPIDRPYIESFLAARSSDIAGRVLEVQENDFTRRFGGVRVMRADVIDLDDRNPRATLVADLRCMPHVPPESFDCVILTQTLHVIDDMPAVLRECRRILGPDGVLLATLPAASRVCLEYGEDGDLWRVTPAGARALFEPVFGSAHVECEPRGNVLTSIAFLEGLGAAELEETEFDSTDPYFPSVVTVRAVKAKERGPGREARGLVLLYHRIEDGDDVHGLNVTPSSFAAHLDWLRRECVVMPLDELLATPPGRLPARAVALTFDDGYLDNLTTAAPALCGLPATFFVTTRWLDEPGEYWWDLLERVLLGGGPLPPSLRIELEGAIELPTTTAAERRASHDLLHPRLVHATIEVRDRAIAQLNAWCGGGVPARRPMVADELRTLMRLPGVRIGAHTVNHLALPDQPVEARRREVEACRAALERLTGTAVSELAYPYGSIDRGCLEGVRPVWRWACACDNAAVPFGFDAARVPRLDVQNWDPAGLSDRVEVAFRRGPARPRP